VKPDTHSLAGVFASDVRYVVPLYQRPYVWRKRSHWEPLWEDVLHVLDLHLDKDASTRGHFLGAVVLEQEHTNPGEIPRRLVIDGQQRLSCSCPQRPPSSSTRARKAMRGSCAGSSATIRTARLGWSC
jgi:hypothetical protein